MPPLRKPQDRDWPQEGRVRMILPAPVGRIGTGADDPEPGLIAQLDSIHVFMMGDNPALPRMPEKPTLMDFFNLRFTPTALQHLTSSARKAVEDGLSDTVVMAILLHDISNGCLIRADHGYWGAQLVAPYVSEEVAWAVKYHQPLRYVADPEAGYDYPESYRQFFGTDYRPPAYIRRDAAIAKSHEWYMTARLVTLYDIYFFDDLEPTPIEFFADIIDRNFRQPEEGLGLDDSPSSHMWRTTIWPNNFL